MGTRHVGVLVSGHLAWVVGDHGAVGFEFESKTAATYAKT